ncbi:glutathionylspermidine synthase family protein [Labilithrix luteola]|nr:glutathionylspermidine synthase family protein [Labilithrix luteola]
MELSHFKWDAQIGDVTTLTPYALLITPSTWNELARLAEALTRETLAMEAELLGRPELHDELALPRPLRELLQRGEPTPSAVRTMRFDFHYTTDGWRISEVNSDVPGGFTEASAFTQYMSNATPGTRPTGDPTKAIVDAMERVIGRSGKSGVVALMNAPGHMEDHQVVAHLASTLCARGRRLPSSRRCLRA